jgi:hypothetical protein
MIDGSQGEEDACRTLNPDIAEVIHVNDGDPSANRVLKRRMQIASDLLSRHDQVLCLDSDIIVRKSLEHIWDGVVPSTLKIWFKGSDRKPRTRFQGAVYILGNSPACRRMYAEVISNLEGSKGWFDCQEQLYLVWHKYKALVPRVDLPTVFNDNFFMPASAIWHAKHGHDNEPAWKIEWDRWKAEVDARFRTIHSQ